MPHAGLIAITLVVALGIGAQFLAARLRLPSILLLLAAGLAAGPWLGWLDPDELLGELLLPLVSVCVALILYEGGLSLSVRDLPRVGGVVRNLLLIGMPVTWLAAALAGRYVLGLDWQMAALLGAVLVVTGPTVIGPMLRHMRPEGQLGPILMWEGIVIDPLGAIAAVLTFQIVTGAAGPAHTLAAVGQTAAVGGLLGLAAAGLLTLLIYRYWVPDHLQSAVSLMLAVVAFTLANLLADEAGLLAVTVMGIALTNQPWVDVRHIVEFKENLRVLLISSLFILLAARLELADLTVLGWAGALFVLLLIVLARPLAVLAATLGTDLPGRQRAVLAWMAPRGIVAAAVASVFALKLEAIGHAQARLLVPATFAVIVGTVAVYGLTAPLLARRLGLADSDPQGLLILGAQPWARQLAAALHQAGVRVLLVDSNRANIAQARLAGLPTYAGSILAEYAIAEMPLGGLGRILALTPNDWVNTLAVHRFIPVFGRRQCYQLVPQATSQSGREMHKHMQGRWLFGEHATYAELARRFAAGATIKATTLSEQFDYTAFTAMHGSAALPLFVRQPNGRLRVIAADQPPQAAPGETLISLIDAPAAGPATSDDRT